MKEYIATSDPSRGGAYLENLAGLCKKEIDIIEERFLSIEAISGKMAVSVCPVSQSTLAVCMTRKKKSVEEPRMHSVSLGVVLNTEGFSTTLQRMEAEGFSYLSQELDEHDRPVVANSECERDISEEVSLQYMEAYSANERVNIFYAVICILENNEKILLQMDEAEKVKWIVMLYSLLPPEIATKIFVSTGECPKYPPDILIADKILTQSNEYEYIKKTIPQFEKYGEIFRRRTNLKFPYLESCISEPEGLEKLTGLKDNQQVRDKNIRDMLNYYESVLQLSENKVPCLVETSSSDQNSIQSESFISKSNNLLERCKSYITGEDIFIYDLLREGALLKDEEWKKFQSALRKNLKKYNINKLKNTDRFINILFLAFQISGNGTGEIHRNLWCCYDLQGMQKFIEKNKWSVKKILLERKIKRYLLKQHGLN